MAYFVTGATGFIGRHLVARLLARGGSVHVLVRPDSVAKLDDLAAFFGPGAERVTPVLGDLGDTRLGVSDADVDRLRGTIDHCFHLAALYDITAGAVEQVRANVDGTRHAVRFAEAVEAGTFHHVSSIAAAGLFPGEWREDMFSEATNLDTNPYFRTKHEAERVVREECSLPWRVYRPGIVVGHSETGEIDKIDGPYYFFKAIQKIRDALPRRAPMVGVEGGTLNLVPVDFVAAALDHIAHEQGLDRRAFHLTDPDPMTVGQILNTVADAAHAPRFSMRLDAKIAAFVPSAVKKGLRGLGPVKRITDNTLASLGIPRAVLAYVNYPTNFDRRATTAALAGSGIEVPPFETYAWRLWDYWERHLDPDLFVDRSLRGAVADKVVMITGASSGIGRETALRVGEAGAIVLLVARTPEKLEATRDEIVERGGVAHIHRCDLADMADIDRMADAVLAAHGHVDVLVNNAGRSIRRSVALSYDRFHDYERTMQLNYFGAVRLVLRLLPTMRERGSGHIVNVSSIGVQTNTPRFSAYVASKAALDAFSRCIASEVVDDGIDITTVHMPLVRTPMIAPTKIYDYFPTRSPEEAADMICEALRSRPKRIATRLGTFGQVLYALSPKTVDVLLNQAYKLFPDSLAATAGRDASDDTAAAELPDESIAFAHIMSGIHW